MEQEVGRAEQSGLPKCQVIGVVTAEDDFIDAVPGLGRSRRNPRVEPLCGAVIERIQCATWRECGIERTAPLGTIRPAPPHPFACGMNMVHGLLRVEGEDGSDENTPLPHPDASYTAPTAVDAAEADRREAAERANEIKALTKLVIVGAVLTLPVFAVTMLHMAHPTLVPHWMVNPWLQAILITPVMFYCGRPIHTVGFPALAHHSPDMNSLVSLGTSAAYLYSLVTCIAPWVFPEGSREPYFESVGVVITLVLVGRLVEAKAREGTGKAVQSLIRLRPRTAHKLNATSADNVDGIEWRNPAHFTDTDIDANVTNITTGSGAALK